MTANPAIPVSQKSWFKRFGALAKPYWTSNEKWPAIGLLAVIISLTLGIVYLNVQFNSWYNDFYDALQNYDMTGFWAGIKKFFVLATIYIFVAVYQLYLQQMLQIRWRRWLTAHLVEKWMSNRTYYLWQLEQQVTDNPDQRISEDVGSFVTSTLALSLGLLREVVMLVSFVTILWKLSGAITLGGIVIPGYMVWAALVYCIVGTWITHKIGRPLFGLNYNQQRFEANFRFSLVRLRENSESVALSRGELAEKRTLMGRFDDVYANFRAIMDRQKQVVFFTNLFGQTAVLFPIVMAAPRYFAKQIKLGGLIQISHTFGKVQDSMSFFIDAYTRIADLAAVILRLDGFLDSVQAAEERAPLAEKNLQTGTPGTGLTVSNVSLSLPGNQPLLDGISFSVRPGESLLVSGPSGIGKSTLFRAISGIWPYWDGKVEVPAGMRGMVVPQKPYLPVDTLRAALTYPELPSGYSEEEIRGLLVLCKLTHLEKRLDDIENWSLVLSPGEQQRVAFVRVFLHKPNWLFLDEATSAVDESTQTELYNALRERLPGLTVISIAHRASLKALHQREYDVLARTELTRA